MSFTSPIYIIEEQKLRRNLALIADVARQADVEIILAFKAFALWKTFPIFREYNVRKAVLFGSYAKGLAKEKSDIDLLVDSSLKGLAFFGLLEDVVNALDKDVDLIDTSQVIADSNIEHEIKATGIVIYKN